MALFQAKTKTFVISDPGKDAVILVDRVPEDQVYTIEAVYFSFGDAIAASTANYLDVDLVNAGTGGTDTGSMMSTVGGTPGWVKNVPKAGTITDGSGDLTALQYLGVRWAETGTIGPLPLSVTIEYVEGIGEKAYA